MCSMATASSPSLGVANSGLVAHGQRFEAGAGGALHVPWRIVAAQRLQRAAQNAHDPVGTLGVTPEPEQIVGDAALDDALRTLHARGFDGRLPQAAVRRHLPVGDDPDVARPRFRRAQGNRQVGHDGHGQAARHHHETVGGRGDEQADGERLRDEALRREGGCRPEADALLGHQQLAVQQYFFLERLALRLGQARAELAVLRAAGTPGSFLRLADHHAVEVGDDVLAVGGVAEPPPRRIGDEQVFAIEAPADRRQVGAEPAILRHGRAECVAHQIGCLAACLHEAARAAVTRAVEFEGIGLAAVDAAHDEVDALQSLQRLQKDAVARGAQVAALDEQIAEIAGEVGMAEVVVVVRARRQQRDARIAAPGERRQVGLHALEERREAQTIAGFEQVAGDVRVDDAVGESVADAGRRLGVIVDDAPAAVDLARQIDRIELQMTRRRRDAVARVEEGRVGEQQRRRDQALAQQLLLPISVGENGVEQAGALNERRFQRMPLAAGKDEWDEVDLPAFSRRGRIGEDIVRDAHLAHAAVETFGALAALGGGQLGEGGEEGFPVRTHFAARIDQFVIAAVAQAGVAGQQSPVELEGEPRFQVHGLTFMGQCPANCASLAGPAIRCSARG